MKRRLPLLGFAVVLLALLPGSGSTQIPPLPIDPDNGEATLLALVNSLPLNDIQNALENHPVPYVVVASADGAAPTIASKNSGSPIRIDADRSLATGRGGHDIEVEVNTELLPTPHLQLDIFRIGTSNFAPNLSVIVAFPFDAFNTEDGVLPGDPNLFFGYHTTGAFDGSGYPVGGIAPQHVSYSFTPGVLDGTNHLFTVGMDTVGAPNPIRFLTGHFDGDAQTGILNATAFGTLTDPVPASIDMSLDISESLISLDPSALTDSSIGVSWAASSPTKVMFDYLEDESFPFDVPDQNTTLTFDQMPTSEELSLSLDEDNEALVLSHRASAPIDDVTLLHEREDGLMVRGTMGDVPTEMDLSVNLDGQFGLDVNANTLDLEVEASQIGGFAGTGGFLGYPVGYISAGVTNAPDLTAELQPADDRYRVLATNAGESIGAASLVIDDGPIAIYSGLLDVDGDGDGDGNDDGTESSRLVEDGKLDVNGDGVVDGADDGPIPGAVPEYVANDGMVIADEDDDGLTGVTLLELPPAWTFLPQQHVLSMVDDGSSGTVAGRAVNLSEASLDLDAPALIDGGIDMNQDGVVDGDDDGTLGIDFAVIDGLLDLNQDSVADANDDGSFFGRTVVDGRLDADGDDDVDANDDGPMTNYALRLGTTAAAQLQGYLSTEPTSNLIPGHDIDATCDVNAIPAGTIDFRLGLPPPSIHVGYEIDPPQDIEEIHCFGHVDAMAFDLLLGDLPPVFEFDFDPDRHLMIKAENGSGPNTDTLGVLAIRFCDDPNMDGICVAGQTTPGGIPGTGELLGFALHDARARADQIPSFVGRWSDGSGSILDGRVDIDANAVINGVDDGLLGGATIIDGLVDLNGSGVVTGADDGRLLGRRVVNGTVDLDGDGDVDGNDDGTISGSAASFDTGRPDATLFLEGVQLDVSTEVGLPPLPAADPTSDHFARFIDEGGSGGEKRFSAGAFGIDEARYSSDDGGKGLALHYAANEDHGLLGRFDSAFGGRFFPAFETDLTLTVDDVPQTWDFFTDMTSEAVYDGSDGISSIDLDGAIDDTNDSDATNGTSVDFTMDTLPAHFAFHLAGDLTDTIDGRLDTNNDAAVDGNDDAIRAGVRFIDGFADVNGDGAIDGNDDGEFVGVPVIDGGLDLDQNGTVDGNDDGALAGATVVMDAPIELIALELASTNHIIGTDYRRVEASVEDIPARWTANWGGGRFLVESKNAAGNPSPMGAVQALVSTAFSAGDNTAKIEPFTLDGAALGGPILGGTAGGCRVSYSEFAQEIDNRYYSSFTSGAAARLRDLYCDSEQLDSGEDHLVARMGDVNGDGSEAELDFGSFKFTGFQRVSWVPDANGGQFIFRAPTPGLHPLFGGFEQGDQFATLQIANIPDQIIVDVDDTEHVNYDASDDTDASIQQIDAYYGPLPTAQDGDDAVRAVVNFGTGTPASLTEFVHVGWAFGFPSGGAFVDSSEPIEVLALAQDGDTRITGGLSLEDLHAGYAIEFFSFDVTDTFCFVPDPTNGCLAAEVPVAWELIQAKAGIDNDADGLTPAALLTTDPDEGIAGNSGKPDVAGFLAVYDRIGSPAALVPSGPAAGGNEYVPVVTAEEAGFREFSVDAFIELDPLNFSPALFYPFDLEVDVTVTGQLVFDVWSTADTNFVVSIPGIVDAGIINPPDYSENSPFHIIPGLFEDPIGNAIFVNDHDLVYRFNGWHDFGDHIDPFGP